MSEGSWKRERPEQEGYYWLRGLYRTPCVIEVIEGKEGMFEVGDWREICFDPKHHEVHSKRLSAPQ